METKPTGCLLEIRDSAEVYYGKKGRKKMQTKEMNGKLKELFDKYNEKGCLDEAEYEEYKDLLREWMK